MGEATFLGFIKGYPSHVVGFVSSGTGFAGISSTSTLLILQGIGLSNQAIFLIVMPTYFVYIACATWLNKQKQLHPYLSLKNNNEEKKLSLNMTNDSARQTEIDSIT